MSFQTDIQPDYAVFDGGEDVTLVQIRPDGSTSVAISNAVNAPLRFSTTQTSGVALTGRERSWSINATQPGALGVEVGDYIVQSIGTDNQVRWEILYVELLTLNTRYRCLARREVQ